MKIATISDTHGRHEEIDVPEDADIVLHAGDISSRGHEIEILAFFEWFGNLPNKYKVMVAGNHDFGFERDPEKYAKLAMDYGIVLLNDSDVTIEGLKIWGSPVQPEFCNWAFNRSRTIEDSMNTKYPYIGNHWDLIPNDADIIITHGPAYGILDKTYYGSENVGCKVLARKIAKIKPILHVSGHIHEARGACVVPTDNGFTTFVNTSSLNLRYDPYQDKTFVFELDKLKKGTSYGRD